jgi:hypothetical protein
MRLFITLFVFILFVTVSSAQQKVKFHSQNYIGALGGNLDAAFQFVTINGVQRGLYFGGFGTGLDFYYIRSVPLFLSVSRYLNANKSSPYFMLDGGTNFVWDNSTANRYNLYYSDGDFTPSLYFGAHAGYKFGINKKSGSVLATVGYSAKKIKETVMTGVPCIWPPCPFSSQKVDYQFNRFSLRLGWMF